MSETAAPEQTTEERKPWALVCHKGDLFGGVISPDLPKEEIVDFLADFVAEGYSIVTVYDRDEYNLLWQRLR